MGFRWDPAKARANLGKHGVAFADAVGVFEDPRALTRDDPHPSEERFVTMGLDLLGRVIVVSWAMQAEHIRLISSRKASPSERRHYESGNDDA